MRKVIFTDIDGVLHPADAVQVEWEGNEWRAVGKDLFCWAPLLWDLIAPYPVDLVIHSTWRYSYTLEELREWFPDPMRNRIVDVTGWFSRHESIVNYAEEKGVERFLVLDDMPAEFPKGWTPLVCCRGESGLTDDVVRQRVSTFVGDWLNDGNGRDGA